ncbi:MAG: hypothetical protein KGK17_08315 [Betaproteobacteria bacterium]|nr:hypothetical protein [Betaproteobacteria bacterium]
MPGPSVLPKVRPPEVGQEWVYALRNVYNQDALGVITEKVVAVGDKIRIQRTSSKIGALPDEIQGPWGMILQDSHWTPAPRFSTALPLWPLELRPGWSGHFRSQYEVVGHPGFNYYWILNMEAVAWEEITTPAGKFQALKFSNMINYQSDELIFRLYSDRMETLWLVPEIGRWIVRRSTGRYFIEDRGGDMREDYLEWELVSWK